MVVATLGPVNSPSISPVDTVETVGGRAGRALPVALFALWTLFVWGGRLRNLWLEPGGLGVAGRWSLAGAIAFTVLGLVVAAVWLTGRFLPRATALGSAPLERFVVLGLAGLTVVVWLIRGVDIALGDHGVGFIVVHLVLAGMSMALAWLAARRG